MPYSITCSIKTLIASFLFILVSILYEFNMVPFNMVHFTVPSGRRGALFLLKAQMYTFSSTFIKSI